MAIRRGDLCRFCWSRVLHKAACHSLIVLVIVTPSCYLLTKYVYRLTLYIIVKHIDQGIIWA